MNNVGVLHWTAYSCNAAAADWRPGLSSSSDRLSFQLLLYRVPWSNRLTEATADLLAIGSGARGLSLSHDSACEEWRRRLHYFSHDWADVWGLWTREWGLQTAGWMDRDRPWTGWLLSDDCWLTNTDLLLLLLLWSHFCFHFTHTDCLSTGFEIISTNCSVSFYSNTKK